MLDCATRAVAERGNSLLKNTFKARKQATLCPWRIGASAHRRIGVIGGVVAAALVVLPRDCDHTT